MMIIHISHYEMEQKQYLEIYSIKCSIRKEVWKLVSETPNLRY